MAHSCHQDSELFSVELITSIEEEYKDIDEPHARGALLEPSNARSHAERCELWILRSDLSAVHIGNAQHRSGQIYRPNVRHEYPPDPQHQQ